MTATRVRTGALALLLLAGIVAGGTGDLPGCQSETQREATVNPTRPSRWDERDRRYRIKIWFRLRPPRAVDVSWRVGGRGHDFTWSEGRFLLTTEAAAGERVILRVQQTGTGGMVSCFIEQDGLVVQNENRNDAGDCKVAHTVGEWR